MNRIILASASPRRRELLKQIGVRFEVVAAKKEEHIVPGTPADVVKGLSMQKALEVAGRTDGDIIIGADTVVSVNGQILGKPKDKSDAVRMLCLLEGRMHQVITGVTVILKESGKMLNFAEETKVCVFPMTEAQIKNYAESGEPQDKAGAYGIQGRFAAFIRGIEGDYNNVVGLPVGRLCQEALAAGVDLLQM